VIESRTPSCLPTFLVVGAMKCGTGSIIRYLGSHPEIFAVREPGEPDFFSRNWDRGLAWYEGLFAPGREHPHRGEKSPSYTFAPETQAVPERVASVVPDVRLVYLVRNPVERIRSMYTHWLAVGREKRPIVQAVIEDSRYVDRSRYAFQIEQYLEYFDRRQILVVRTEDLRSNRSRALETILKFIGATPDPHLVDASTEWNTSERKRRPTTTFETAHRVLGRSHVLGLIPKPAKRRVRWMLSRHVDNSLTPPVERELWDRLEPDLARLREIVGTGVELWTQGGDDGRTSRA
jgi:hypothetical protein